MGKTFNFLLLLFFDDLRILKSFPIKLMNRNGARNSVSQDENNLSNRLFSFYNITILAFSWIIISLILWGFYFAVNKKSSVIQKKDLFQILNQQDLAPSEQQEIIIPPAGKDFTFTKSREEAKQTEPAEPLERKEIISPAQIVRKDIYWPIVTEEAPLLKASVKPIKLYPPPQNPQQFQPKAFSTPPVLNPAIQRDICSRHNVPSCLCFKNPYERKVEINSINNVQYPKQQITNQVKQLEPPKPYVNKEPKETFQVREKLPQSRNDMDFPIVTEDIPLLKAGFRPTEQDSMNFYGNLNKLTASSCSSSDDKVANKYKEIQHSPKITQDNTIFLKGAAQLLPLNPDKLKNYRVLSSTEYKPPVEIVQPLEYDVNIILRPVSAFTTEDMKNPSTLQTSPFPPTIYPLQPSHSNLYSPGFKIVPENSYMLSNMNKDLKKSNPKTENQYVVPSKSKRRSADIYPIIQGYKVEGHVRVKGKKNTDTISFMEDEYDVLT